MPVVTFKAQHFSTTPGPEAINDMLGHDVADWLRAELAAQAFDVGPVIAEDYGYGFWIKRHGSHYWISHGRLEPDEWLVAVDYDPGCLWIWRLRKRPRPEDQRAIAQAVHVILTGDDRLQNIRWWRKDIHKDSPTATPVL